MRPQCSRRALLGGLCSSWLLGLAGCSRPGSNRGATDVVVHNQADAVRTVDLTVARRGASPVVDARIELRPGDRERINNEVIQGDDYVVDVSFVGPGGEPGYSETHEWTDADRPLHVVLTTQVVFAVQVG